MSEILYQKPKKIVNVINKVNEKRIISGDKGNNAAFTNGDDLSPIVLLHGIFGFGKGAQELFYYLKGGQVDYGEEHSKACEHSQFERIY
ncbi:hypothetical protein HN51_045508 [Arachis hypogaea]